MVDRDNASLRKRIQGVWAMRNIGASVVPSTMAEERATNPFLRVEAPEIKWRIQEEFPEVDTDDPVAVFTALREWKDRRDHRAMPDDVLPI